jgi:hypothetical protein
MNIELYIERVVMEGVAIAGGQDRVVQAAIEIELANLLRERGLDQIHAGAVPHLFGDSVQLTQDVKPKQLGKQIAGAIYGALTPSTGKHAQ